MRRIPLLAGEGSVYTKGWITPAVGPYLGGALQQVSGRGSAW